MNKILYYDLEKWHNDNYYFVIRLIDLNKGCITGFARKHVNFEDCAIVLLTYVIQLRPDQLVTDLNGMSIGVYDQVKKVFANAGVKIRNNGVLEEIPYV